MSQQTFLHSSVGDYQLVDFLGAGGMGEVYRAVHSKIGRVVAVKILNAAAQGSTFVDRFLNEARIQSRLQHQNIATLYDFLEVSGKPCIVMEYIDGETLAERITARGPLQSQEVLSIFQPVLQAVSYIHENGIVHRDIKSSNIKITSRGEVKLLDFGIAKGQHTPQLTTTGSVIGTLQYLAPELLSGGGADARTDVWALGVLLYEMVTAKMPFEGSSLPELFTKIQSASYSAPSRWSEAVPAQVEKIISKCLKRRAEDRYATAQGVLDDVRSVGERVSASVSPAPPANSGESLCAKILWRWIAAAIGVLAVIVLAVSLFWSSEPQAVSPSSETTKDTATQVSPSSQRSGDNQNMRPVVIDVAEGQAGVYRGGDQVGNTPYEFKAKLGEKVDLVLKAQGFNDLRVTFDVGENRNKYVYPLEKTQEGGR